MFQTGKQFTFKIFNVYWYNLNQRDIMYLVKLLYYSNVVIKSLYSFPSQIKHVAC